MGISAWDARTAADVTGAENAGLERAALIGNFTPRVCGIATFTRDLLRGLTAADPRVAWDVVAMNDREPGFYTFGPDVNHVVQQERAADYLAVAKGINRSGAGAVFVQHEFGIFGGTAGEHLLLMLRALRAPIIVTLHTVLAAPNADQRRVLNAIVDLAHAGIVMADTGARLLQTVYDAPASKLVVIPHGAPSRPPAATGAFKQRFGLDSRPTLMTFGLLSPNKGIETVIRAMPKILYSAPDALYVVAGATHPNLVRERGEAYRESLVQLAANLDVARAVRFIDKYMADDELIDLLQATDVYVTPYLTQAQITSGTLSYAIALGRPIVSTPYWHAAEALANGVGVLCPFGDSDAFGDEIGSLLTDDARRMRLAERARKAGVTSRWPSVGAAYLRAAGVDADSEALFPGSGRSHLAAGALG